MTVYQSALLSDGRVIPLEQDCECSTHSGPHWLYMDDIWHQSNRRLLERGNALGYASEELARLRDKALQMESRRIVELLETAVPPVEPLRIVAEGPGRFSEVAKTVLFERGGRYYLRRVAHDGYILATSDGMDYNQAARGFGVEAGDYSLYDAARYLCKSEEGRYNNVGDCGTSCPV